MPSNARIATSSKFLIMFAGHGKGCVFCASHKEPKKFVRSHSLFNADTGHVECPVLRDHHCEECGATGNDAHTRSHCPKLHTQEGRVLSIARSLMATQRKSDGKKRNC